MQPQCHRAIGMNMLSVAMCRGVTVAIVYQLSTADCCKNSINMSSWAMGDGPYASLLGVNVIGTAVAW